MSQQYNPLEQAEFNSILAKWGKITFPNEVNDGLSRIPEANMLIAIFGGTLCVINDVDMGQVLGKDGQLRFPNKIKAHRKYRLNTWHDVS